MVEEVYIESITEQTKNEIEMFLKEHTGAVVDYHTWRKSLELSSKAFKEIVDSVSGFREKFDEIIDEFKSEDNDGDTPNLSLINETNKKLDDLYKRYYSNAEIWELIQELNDKRYNL